MKLITIGGRIWAIIFLFFYSFVGAKEVTVTGSVVKASNSEPIASALVLLFEASLDMSSAPNNIDTSFSGPDGKFERKITVSDTGKILAFGAHIPGLLAKTDIKLHLTPMPEKINVGEIKLRPLDDAKDTMIIKGSVVDSVTNEPIKDAQVVVTTGLIGDLNIDTLITDDNGKFEKKIPFIPTSNPLFPNQIIYMASKENYRSNEGLKDIPSDNVVDCGVLAIAKINSPIINPEFRLTSLKPTHIKIFTLKGKSIYKGLYKDFAYKTHLTSGKQPLIFVYYRKNKIIWVQKGSYLF